MTLTFAHVLSLGEGNSPQMIHDMDNTLRLFYLTTEGTVACKTGTPILGQYSYLPMKDIGRVSPDDQVYCPAIKKIAHHGAYGFWSSGGYHRFVQYMLPSDISHAFVSGKISYRSGNEISSFSCNLINPYGMLLNRTRALVTPGTKLTVSFCLGNSAAMPMGQFYIDRASIKYPEGTITISARNAIGKLLKEQTFDENTDFDYGSTRENLSEILRYAGLDDYFVSSLSGNIPLHFEPDTTLLEGLHYAMTMLPEWKLEQTSTGVVGLGLPTDYRFDKPGVYSFERDHDCFSYSTEYDDADAASRVCVWSKSSVNQNLIRRLYVDASFCRFWQQAKHRTLYVQTIDDATETQMRIIAERIAGVLSISGRTEQFTGVFTPALIPGDEVQIASAYGGTESIGTVTDLTHSFGKNGFSTEFTVESGGRKGKALLKDLITAAVKQPTVFTGARNITTENG